MQEAWTGMAGYCVELAERLLLEMGSDRGLEPGQSDADIAAYQFLWGHYMVTGIRRFGDAVLQSLQAICRSAYNGQALASDASQLELLTWVWRIERCPDLRRRAEEIAASVITRSRVPGFGFAASAGSDERDESIRAGENGLMLVALIEAGSVFERREWLALARTVFDELVDNLAAGGGLWHAVVDGCRSAVDLDDYAMMSRAAARLFEAFGKQRYLDYAETWTATLDATLWQAAGTGYRKSPTEAPRPASRGHPTDDGAVLAGNAPMIGVLARLHALTGRPGYAERAERLVEALRPLILRSGVSGATAVANARTAAQLVSIEISGDPKLQETRALMRIALDSGLPDRLVLGPGAGRAEGERPRAQIRVGAHRLLPIDDPAALRKLVAPGGLTAAFRHQDARVTVDS